MLGPIGGNAYMKSRLNVSVYVLNYREIFKLVKAKLSELHRCEFFFEPSRLLL